MTEMEYLYHFITYGTYRIIAMWLNKDQRESPDKLSSLILKQTLIK